MRTSFLSLFTLSGLFAGSLAAPTIFSRQVGLCASGTPQCCDLDVLGIANLNCQTPPEVPTDIQSFNDICASVGQINQCCLLPILGQALLCNSPDGS
ncbi:hypothetical protein W97_06189 [Coniosporium apollinis CBS 100218]|uniref:Hydrophobin n=1 Tax=Coniosporium apollinis (strain CBS 100218) TaxID=1168221 RepID=R7YYU5_CONA1|nr:uncharacterized protein W97_06189 [Coniosporium apollinis CBS 100218]EON67072.1 hypothetical protein W97_06189 [Coniosporium apollinis CBS 100218]